MSLPPPPKADPTHPTSRRPVNGAAASRRESWLAEAANRLELSSLGLFLREFINDPRSIGAVAPSSKKLARQMAAFVPAAHDGLVVDLGAGTGVMTAALLDQGISPERLVAVERSARMARHFRERFPQVPLIEGDAQRLDVLLQEHFGDSFGGVDFVVSGLPFRSLPEPVVRAIEEKVHQVLNAHGRFIQFTYDLRPPTPRLFKQLNHCTSRMVWCNFPPARVDVFMPKRNGSPVGR